MDPRANRLKPQRQNTGGLGTGHVLVLIVGVLGALAAIRLAFSVPKPLLGVAAALFLVCAFSFWIVRSRLDGVAASQAIRLLLAWVAISALLFGTAFWVDRAGWIWFRMTGYNVTLSEDYPQRVGMHVSDFVRHNPAFDVGQAAGNHLVLRGTHDFDATIVVPRGTHLTIEPGTVLRFGRGCSLISYGAITAHGTEQAPIVFTARLPLLKWGVVGVVGESPGTPSSFEHVRFEHGRQARVNGLDFHGALSCIGGPVRIRNSRFVRLYGKDAVYVRGGHVDIRDNLFQNTFKDGLDLDGGSGDIRQNRFVDCGDEGIDLSHNDDVRVYDNTILDARGGRIGADENLSEIRAHNTLGYTDGPSETESLH